MRRTAAVLVCLLALAGCGGTAEKTTEHREMAYTVRYPASWRAPAQRILRGARFEVARTPAGKRTPDATLDVLLYDDPGSLGRAARDFVTRSRVSPGFRLLGQEKTSVDGAPAAYRIRKRYRSASADDGSALTLEQTDVLTVVRSGERLDVRYICQVARCGRYQEQADAMLDSVTVG